MGGDGRVDAVSPRSAQPRASVRCSSLPASGRSQQYRRLGSRPACGSRPSRCPLLPYSNRQIASSGRGFITSVHASRFLVRTTAAMTCGFVLRRYSEAAVVRRSLPFPRQNKLWRRPVVSAYYRQGNSRSTQYTNYPLAPRRANSARTPHKFRLRFEGASRRKGGKRYVRVIDRTHETKNPAFDGRHWRAQRRLVLWD